MLGKILKAVEGAVFPEGIYCIACDSVIDKSRNFSLCDSCIQKLQWIGPNICDKCGKPINQWSGSKFCYDCSDGDHVFDKGFTCTGYGLYERTILMDFKYSGKAYIGKALGEIMFHRFLEIDNEDWDFLVPVPIHQKRMKKRGYNQAEILAKELGKAAGIKVKTNLLRRSENTEAMKNLSTYDRRENLKEAFSLISGGQSILSGAKILLIDDIYTTGATADSCAVALKKGGATRVDIFTFTAGVNPLASVTDN